MTPEIIGASIVAILAVLGVLQRYGIFRLPFSRNLNSKPSNCDKRHDKVDRDLQAIKALKAEGKL